MALTRKGNYVPKPSHRPSNSLSSLLRLLRMGLSAWFICFFQNSPLFQSVQLVKHWPFLSDLCSLFGKILSLLVFPDHLSPAVLSNAQLFSPVRQLSKEKWEAISVYVKAHYKRKWEAINVRNALHESAHARELNLCLWRQAVLNSIWER